MSILVDRDTRRRLPGKKEAGDARALRIERLDALLQPRHVRNDDAAVT